MEPIFITREEANTLVGTKVNDIEMYRRAFIHKSALKVYNFETSNETLEFMGDSVLGFIVTKFLFDKFEKNQEGFLTRARTKLVCGKTLAAIAEKLGLYKWTIMDEKGMRNEWFRNPKIMEDVFEAFVGAIYLDLGMIHTRQFVLRVFNDPEIVDMNAVLRKDDNFKDILMRYCQARKYDLPEYVMDAKDSTRFRVRVFVTGNDRGFGVGTTKKEAEQKAACFALKNLRGEYSNNNHASPCTRTY